MNYGHSLGLEHPPQRQERCCGDQPLHRPGRGTRMDIIFVMLLLGLGGTLFAFLIYTVLRRMG